MTKCIGIRMSIGGKHHEHITHIRWVDDVSNKGDTSTRADMVAFVEQGGKAYVRDAQGDVAFLRVRTSSSGTKYVQTYADGIFNDNLLALPRI